MADLLAHFGAVFCRGLDLERNLSEASSSIASYAEVSQQVADEIARAKDAAGAGGKRPQDIEEASFAVVAWLDELMARRPEWVSGGVPLQVREFNTYNAGDEFFDHLAQLDRSQDEVREVYLACLCLGFVGKHYLETGEGSELRRLIESHSRQLPIVPARVHTLHEEYVTPQPYLERKTGPIRIPSAWDRTILRLATLLAVTMFAGAIIYWLIQPPPLLGPSVANILHDFDCANLSTEIDEDSRSVKVWGYVATSEDANAVLQQLGALEDVGAITSDVAVLKKPFCRVVDVLKPYLHMNGSQNHGVSIMPANKSTQQQEDDYLILDAVAADFPGYLYVDYWTTDSYVVHVLPDSTQRRNRVKPSEQRRLGDDATKNRWQVTAPLGQEMVVAISSEKPVFEDLRPDFETADEYLQALQVRLQELNFTEKLAASYFLLESVEASP